MLGYIARAWFLNYLLMAAMLPSPSQAKATSDQIMAVQPAEQPVLRQQSTQGLPDKVKEFINKKKIPEDQIGVFIKDVAADAPLVLHDAEKLFNPASTMKLLTTWSALKVLGPAWRWNTEFWVRGQVIDGVLHGDLIIKGYGDPYLVYESFWQALNDLRIKGLRDITGDIVIDNSFFDTPEVNPGEFDGQPTRVYNAPPSAVMFNFQATRLLLTPQADQNKVDISAFPALKKDMIDNQFKLLGGRCSRSFTRPHVTRLADSVIRVSGKYAADCGQRFVMLVMTSPEEHVFNAFTDFWSKLGGSVGGTYRIETVQEGDQRFHVHTSIPLAEQIRLINKWSNNVMTRQVLLSLGAKRYGAPATLEKGRLAVLESLDTQGVPVDGIVIDNGSGLSRYANVSPAQFGRLLEIIWRDPYMPEFLNSLPLLGEDGTMNDRFRHTALSGRGRFKTGTLSHVSAIAGYLLTRSGKRMVVVVLMNGRQAGAYSQTVQNMLLEWVFEQ
ncbi:MAG: D-alanyl-D-alanine carboxypeptidase/D-alanyl-D-alanine-endopeptidase [Proteobacteria bacterium]|nr:MAG: D-alanyl-D-alanine carboxypeptidase/D-alanyl-D-alanine-endopeptidase [Pseudomonadota bacterium]